MKESIFIFCCTLLIFSCSKNKSEPIQNNNQIIENEISESTTSVLSELKTENEIIENSSLADEQNQEIVAAFKMEPINESVSKPFIYDFPKILNYDTARHYIYSLSDFTDEENLFYENYVGCYVSNRKLSKEYLYSHLSEVTIEFIENEITFWGFCKSEKGVHYNADEKLFYEYEAFGTLPIDNFTDFKFPGYSDESGYQKLTDCQIVEDIISEKKSKMNRPALTESQEEKVRNLLLDFFTTLSKKEFDEIIDNFFVSIKNRKELKDTLFWQAKDLKYQNDTFDIYINVFFNDNIDNYDEDTIFVELKYGHPINYVSFAIKEIDEQLKIQKYVARYDEE